MAGTQIPESKSASLIGCASENTAKSIDLAVFID